MIELTGGNDGLNTVIPHADDVYHKSRPTLRIEPGKVLKLDDRVGLHPALKDLHRLWENGHLAVVQGVGYPEPESIALPVDGDLADGDGRPRAAGRMAGPGRLMPTPAWSSATSGRGPCPWRCRGERWSPSRSTSIADYRLDPGASLGSAASRLVRPSFARCRSAAGTRRTAELARRLEHLRSEPGDAGRGRERSRDGWNRSVRLIEADTHLPGLLHVAGWIRHSRRPAL